MSKVKYVQNVKVDLLRKLPVQANLIINAKIVSMILLPNKQADVIL